MKCFGGETQAMGDDGSALMVISIGAVIIEENIKRTEGGPSGRSLLVPLPYSGGFCWLPSVSVRLLIYPLKFIAQLSVTGLARMGCRKWELQWLRIKQIDTALQYFHRFRKRPYVSARGACTFGWQPASERASR